jgi:hypothetical protein
MASVDWQAMSRWAESDLGRVDIAVANLLCVAGVPGVHSINIDECRRTLDNWAARVRDETSRLFPLFIQQPAPYQNSEPYFRMLVLF